MNLNNIFKINFKKLKKNKGKALFLILPITLLFAISILVSSQTANLTDASDKSVLGTIENQNKLITLKRGFAAFNPREGGGMVSIGGPNDTDTTFYESDLEKIENLDGVVAAEINRNIPIANIVTKDLFEDSKVRLSNLNTMSSETAALYTDEDFSYTEGEPIPIILNAQTFNEMYEDWGGKDKIEFNVNRGPEAMQDSAPMKNRTIDYDKEDLLGKEFTIEFGGLDDLQTFSNSFEEGTIVFTKYTAEELAAAEKARKEDIGEYWDFEKIRKPLSYTFKVVGVIEVEASIFSFVPTDFGSKVMKDLIQNQLDAQVKDIPTSILNTQFFGMTYDGTELSSMGNAFGGFSVRIGGGPGIGSSTNIDGPGAEEEEATSYTIPGLVIQTKRSDAGNSRNPFMAMSEAQGLIDNPNVFDEAVSSSELVSVVIDDIYSRTDVVTELNSNGYKFTDLSNLDVFNTLQDNISKASLWLSIAFVGLSSLVIIITMGKFVSESRREIGIFRAIGTTKGNIKVLFVSQAFLYTLVGYLIGLALGVLALFLSAPIVNGWFNNLIGDTIKETYNVVVPVNASDFSSINFEAIAIYSAVLFVITIVISLIPAIRASRVSPVEAIRGE